MSDTHKLDNKTRYRIKHGCSGVQPMYWGRHGLLSRSHGATFAFQLQFDDGDYMPVNPSDIEEATDLPREMSCELVDHYHTSGGTKIPVTVRSINGNLEIAPKGYGDAASEDGHGTPVLVELYRGHLRLLVWSDINQQDPTHTINLDGARETARKAEVNDAQPKP